MVIFTSIGLGLLDAIFLFNRSDYMINFIVCDDNKNLLEDVVELINKLMMKNRHEYKVHAFTDYNEKFMNIMNEKLSCKIYILDVEVPSQSGIDIARQIRDKDVDSAIIFLTLHNEVGPVLLKEEIMFLTFICKFDNANRRLQSAISKALELVGKKLSVRFEDQGAIYTLPVKDIIYILTDTMERKIVIKTDYAQFRVSKTLVEMEKLLPHQFKHSHRACIVNVDRIRMIDKKNNTIIFDNDDMVDLLSKSCRKELV